MRPGTNQKPPVYVKKPALSAGKDGPAIQISNLISLFPGTPTIV
jgi:hypothetical protein